MAESKNDSLETLVKWLSRLPALKDALSEVPLPQFREDLVAKLDTYSPIWDAATAAGKTKAEVQEYMKQIIDKKYGQLYTIHYMVEKVKGLLLGTGKPLFSLEELALKVEGRTVFLGAFLAAYVVEKTLDELLGQWTGLYTRDFKGNLTYTGDSLVRQVRALTELVGLSSISEKLDLLPKRIEDAAKRDVLGWIQTGRDPNPVMSEYIKDVLDKMKTMTEKVEEKLKQYSANKDKGYSSDIYSTGQAAAKSGYALVPVRAD